MIIFLKTFPLAFCASINPVGIIIILFLLSSKNNPLKKTWLFILGIISFLIIFIFLEFIFLKYVLEKFSFHSYLNKSFNIIDICLGLVLLLGVIFYKNKKSFRDQSLNSKKIVLGGFLFMSLNYSTLIPLFALIKIIFENRLSIINSFIISITNFSIVILPIIILPILISLMPQKSNFILIKLKSFITRRGNLIGKGTLIIIAFYLIIKGLLKF